MTTTADQERDERLWVGDLDHVSDGDWFEDHTEPEPFTAPVTLTKSEGACTRARPGRRGERCGAPIVNGSCVVCDRPRRGVER